MADIAFSTSGFCAILSRDLDAQERSLSFAYGRPEESWNSLEQMYFDKGRANRMNKFVLEPLNFADDIVRSDNGRNRAVFKNWIGSTVHRFGLGWMD